MRQSKLFIRHNIEICFFVFLFANVFIFFMFLKSNPLIIKSVPDLSQIEPSIQPLLGNIPVEKGNKSKLRKNILTNISWVEDFLYYAPKNNMKASEFLMVKVSNSTYIPSVKKSIEDHVEKLTKSFNDYAPEESFILKHHVIKVRGNCIFYISAQNSSEIWKAIDQILLYN